MSAKAATAVCSDEFAPAKVHLTPGLLDRIADLVLQGYAATSHGGLEIGGLLFGRRDGESVIVEEFRPLSCDHSLGPRFILSDGDERKLRDLLNAPRVDPTLQHLEIVGWYCSHTRSDLLLLDRELVLHNTYFADPDKLLVILKPRDRRSVAAGIFLRGADGVMPRCSSTVLELPEIGTPRQSNECDRQGGFRPVQSTVDEHASVLPYLSDAKKRSISDRPGSGSGALIRNPIIKSNEHHSGAAKWKVGVAAVGAIALIAFAAAWQNQQLTDAGTDLTLKLRPEAGKLILSWKSNLATPRRARVDIFDGTSSEHLNITEVFQPSGILLFPHNSGSVQAVLTVETGEGVVVRNAMFTDPSAGVKSSALADNHSENNMAPAVVTPPARNQQLTTEASVRRHAPRHRRRTHYRRLSQVKASAPASAKPRAKQLHANQSP